MDFKKVDYIVVGLGIAGICMCEELRKHGKNFIAVDNGEKGATANSGGVLNPTVLKRFSAVWNVAEFYPFAVSFYQQLADKLDLNVFQETPVLRIFNNVEEQNNWSVASDRNLLREFLSSEFISNTNKNIRADFGFGKVMGAFRIDTDALLEGYKNHLLNEKKLFRELFFYNSLHNQENGITYNTISASAVIFCEGFGAISNPFFPANAIIPNKGEFITIKAPKLEMEVFLKGPLYIIPLGDSLYKVGSTFNPGDFSPEPTMEGKNEILSKLKSMIDCPFEVVGHSAGIRPTTLDRKPLLGSFLENPRLFFLNGLGTRGFTMAPFLAQILYRNIVEGIPIPSEMDINRIQNP